MGEHTGISWTDSTWNPVRGCSRVSAGCEHCYAEGVAGRFSGPGLPYEGLVRITPKGAKVWNGKTKMVPHMLDQPLRWKKPRRIFVNSMSDLFHESISNEDIAAVFGVMAAAHRHTFQVLTKRAKRMREWLSWVEGQGAPDFFVQRVAFSRVPRFPVHPIKGTLKAYPWPLPNVHLGVSVEDQDTADDRVPELLATPAAVRFVSYEPALGPVDFSILNTDDDSFLDALDDEAGTTLDWIIVGGESGADARPFRLEWALSTMQQCAAAGVPIFVKQMGARCLDEDGGRIQFRDRAGAAPDEWPEELRVQQFPEARR